MTNPPKPEPDEELATSTATQDIDPPVWPYVVPLAGFLALTAIEGYLPTGLNGSPHRAWYPVGYSIKLVAVVALLWYCRVIFRDLTRPTLSAILLAIACGLAVTAAWVGLDGLYPMIPWLGKRTEFNPSSMSLAAKWVFVVIRMIGLVVIVPPIEELFYRSFLMRWIVDPIYTRVPIGKVTPIGLGVTTLVFAGSHPEWLPALLTGLAWGGLVWKTRNVTACVISHAVANLALGIYVLATGAWKYW